MTSATSAEAAVPSTAIDSITAAVDMIPRRRHHCDAGEFYQLLVQNIIQQSSELFSNRLQVGVLDLYRCLSCSSIRGVHSKSAMLMLDVPLVKSGVDIDSILWSWSATNLYNEPDATCTTCGHSSVMHNFKVLWSTPDILVVYLMRRSSGTQEVASTPIIIKPKLNVRKIFGKNYNMKDHPYFLTSMLLRKGDTIDTGHWLTVAFPSNNTAVLYDDHIIEFLNPESVLKRTDVMKETTILFYTRGSRAEPAKREKYCNDARTAWKIDPKRASDIEKIWNSKELGKHYGNRTTIYDLKTIEPFNWFNDTIINTFFEALTFMFKRKTVVVMSSFVYTNINKNRKSDLLGRALLQPIHDCEIVLFPVHIQTHWALIAAYPQAKVVVYLDSFCSINYAAFSVVLGFLRKYY